MAEKKTTGMFHYWSEMYHLENLLWNARSSKLGWILRKRDGHWPSKEFRGKILAFDDLIRTEEHLNMQEYMRLMEAYRVEEG